MASQSMLASSKNLRVYRKSQTGARPNLAKVLELRLIITSNQVNINSDKSFINTNPKNTLAIMSFKLVQNSFFRDNFLRFRDQDGPKRLHLCETTFFGILACQKESMRRLKTVPQICSNFTSSVQYYYIEPMEPSLTNSQSLEIVQPSNRMTFNSSSDSPNDPSKDYDLDYSRDEESLSFQIQHPENDRPKLKSLQSSPPIITNDPPKRKRKDIFEKYRKNNKEETQSKPNTSIAQEDDIMRTFDEIFNLNSPRNTSNLQIEKNNQQPPKNYFKKKPSMEAQPVSVSANPNSSLSGRKEDSSDDFQIVKLKEAEPDRGESDVFKTPLSTKTPEKPRVTMGENDILNLEDLQFRISFIEGKENNISFSRDSVDLAQLLGAEIFKQDNAKIDKITAEKIKKKANQQELFGFTQPPSLKKEMEQTNLSPKLPSTQQKSQQDPHKRLSPQPPQRQLQNASSLTDLSKFPDPYQKIDMSSSIASSLLIKDTKYMPTEGNFLGKQPSHQQPLQKTNQNLFQTELHPKLMNYEEHEDCRLPAFLRKLRYLNSIYPNLKNPIVSYSPEKQNEKLEKIIACFAEALKFLTKSLIAIKERDEKKRLIQADFAQGITVLKFLTSGWEQCQTIKNLQKLRPHMNLSRREWNSKKVEKALQNYKKITDHYRKIQLNLYEERGIVKYFQIRKKFWDVQANINMISEDMYKHVVMTRFPSHYREIAQILNQEKVVFQQTEINKMRLLLEKVKFMKARGQPLCVSEVGGKVIDKMEVIIRLSSPY